MYLSHYHLPFIPSSIPPTRLPLTWNHHIVVCSFILLFSALLCFLKIQHRSYKLRLWNLIQMSMNYGFTFSLCELEKLKFSESSFLFSKVGIIVTTTTQGLEKIK